LVIKTLYPDSLEMLDPASINPGPHHSLFEPVYGDSQHFLTVACLPLDEWGRQNPLGARYCQKQHHQVQANFISVVVVVRIKFCRGGGVVYPVCFRAAALCPLEYSDFNKLMGFTSKKLPYIILNNVYLKSFLKELAISCEFAL
jgi:hypothetical protein